MGDADWYRTWGPPSRATSHPDLCSLLPELAIGEYPTPADAEWLRREHRITAVANLQDDADLLSKGLRLRELEAAYERQQMVFQRIPITDCDTGMLVARLDVAVSWLQSQARAGQRIYLHCNAGINRAPTIAIAYLHVQHGMRLAEARDFIRQHRTCMPYMSVLEGHYGP